MSKIEEMASVAEYKGIDREAFEDGYVLGAKAILEEIENAYNKGGVVEALDRFRELKS